MKKLIAFALVVVFVLSACDSADPGLQQTNELQQRITNLREIYSENLSYVGSLLRDNNLTINDENAIINGSLSYYRTRFGEDSEIYQAISREINRNIGGTRWTGFNELTSRSTSSVSEKLQEIHAQVGTAAGQVSSFAEFSSLLNSLYDQVTENDWSESDKEAALAYLVLMQESMQFLDQNQDLMESGSSTSSNYSAAIMLGWWDAWGRCTAGILGGAILGGLAGAAAGSAVPAIGTTAGGIAGAIGGGLSGAAAAC